MVGAAVTGNLRKMRVDAHDPVRYVLPVGEACVELNPLVGRTIGIRYLGNIHCISCGRRTGKSFNQGYCFPCFRALARCDGCIVRPERCHYHLGTCREPTWAKANCLRPHVVYLANSSGVKVGITRESQLPTRWIDQGAIQALPITRVASRRMSGLVEMVFKNMSPIGPTGAVCSEAIRSPRISPHGATICSSGVERRSPISRTSTTRPRRRSFPMRNARYFAIR